MTDTERIDFLERVGGSVYANQSDSLIVLNFQACVSGVTGWCISATWREAVDALERKVRSEFPRLLE